MSSSVSAAPNDPKDDSSSNYYVTAYVSTFMGIVLMVAYILVKGKLIWAQFGSWRVAASKLWQCTVSPCSTSKSCVSQGIKPNRSYHFVSALWLESQRARLEVEWRRLPYMSRLHQRTRHAPLQTHILRRVCLHMVRPREDVSNVQSTGNLEAHSTHERQKTLCAFFHSHRRLLKRRLQKTQPGETVQHLSSFSCFRRRPKDMLGAVA